MSDEARMKAALEKISAIRDSIVGCQSINWSEHIYPLVAALDEAGFPGAGYEIARANVGTLIERAVAAEDALKPFADKADSWEAHADYRRRAAHSTQITHRLRDFRKARDVLNRGKDGE